MNLLKIALLICSTAFLLAGCYRMATEEECSVIPNTNNGQIIRNSKQPWMPSASF